MNDLQIFKTRRGPGILAKLANGSRQRLHDTLWDLADQFFREHNLTLLPAASDFTRQIFSWRVFPNDRESPDWIRDENGHIIGERVVREISPLHTVVAGVYRGQVDTSGPLVPNADYPVAWVPRVWDLYTLHFHPRDQAVRAQGHDAVEQQGIKERDAFYDFARLRVR